MKWCENASFVLPGLFGVVIATSLSLPACRQSPATNKHGDDAGFGGGGAATGDAPEETSSDVPMSLGEAGGDQPAGSGGLAAGGSPGSTTAGAGGSGNGGSSATIAGGTGGSGGAGSTSAGHACGAVGQPCCAGNGCLDNGCCASGLCVAKGSACSPLAGTCSDGTCGSCGGPGMPCCATATSSANSLCTALGTRCVSGVCARCGNLPGQPCCADATTSSGTTSYTCLDAELICSSSAGICTICGQAGSPCCAGNRCDGGGCCYDGACVAESSSCAPANPGAGGTTSAGGVCAASHCSGCGASGKPCCGSSCEAGMVCASGTCTPCGQGNGLCCSGSNQADRCVPGFVCSVTSGSGLCVACGAPGQSCCTGNTCNGGCCFNNQCVAEASACTVAVGGTSYGQCVSGRCTCGNEGEGCCPSGTFTNGMGCSGTLVCSSTGKCVACGKTGGPCCNGISCSDPGTQCLYDDLRYNRICRLCGQLGQACCANAASDSICNDPATGCDSRSICSTCGSFGQPCCKGNLCTASGTICRTGQCVTCGTVGAPCCPGDVCGEGCCVTGYSPGSTPSHDPLCVAAGAKCNHWVASSTAGPVCDPAAAPGGACTSGGTTCGGLGQTCCGDYQGEYHCASAARCQSGGGDWLCKPCGDKGQRCCIDDTHMQGACIAPYRCYYDSYTTDYTCTDATDAGVP